MKLTTGQRVRCMNAENEWMPGIVMFASDTQPQTVAVLFRDVQGIRMNGALAVTNMLPLTIDYEAETATDLWGSTWDIDVAEAMEIA